HREGKGERIEFTSGIAVRPFYPPFCEVLLSARHVHQYPCFPKMLVARKVLSLTKSLAGTNGFQLRTSTISGPARVKVPAAEKAFLGLLIVGGVTFFPAWVLTHLAEYRGGAADE
ncbi:Uncharacterized protein APZ42_022448, partial [Daphnia magna]